MDHSSLPLIRVIPELTKALKQSPEVQFQVCNPDLGLGLYAGETLEVQGETLIHRPLQVWMDLADRLNCHFLTPQPAGHKITLRFRKRAEQKRDRTPSVDQEKYGAASAFQRIHKLEEPIFLLDALEALKSLSLPEGARILDLGVNSGKELQLFELAYPDLHQTFEVVGLDHSETALELAKNSFPQHHYLLADINQLPAGLGSFDLIFSIATLQSANIQIEPVFRSLLRHLRPQGAWVLAFPNSRCLAGEVSYGARMLNYRDPELSLMLKDVLFFKRYFQKHRYSVRITGKYDIFVTAKPVP